MRVGASLLNAFGLLTIGSAALTLDLRTGLEVDIPEPQLDEPELPSIDSLMNRLMHDQFFDDDDFELIGIDEDRKYEDIDPFGYKFYAAATSTPSPSPQPSGNCMTVGEWRPFFDIAMRKITASALDCQKECQMISDCSWWQWMSNDKHKVREKQYRGLCELKTCQPPVAKSGYSNIRVSTCRHTFCKDPNSEGGQVAKGAQIWSYTSKPRVSGRVKREDFRTYQDAIWNGPKDCNVKPVNCTDEICVQYNEYWIGSDLPEGNYVFDWDTVAPMEQCQQKCDANDFCKFWTLTYGPEFSSRGGPFYCHLAGGDSDYPRAKKPMNNAYSAPQNCAKCQSVDIINMTANGELQDVSASEKELYSHIVDNCQSSSSLTGTYSQSVQTTVTKTESIELSRTLSESFTHSLANTFSVSVTVGFKYYVSFSTTLGYSMTDTRTLTKSYSQTTDRIQSETKTKMTAVTSGFSYTVPAGRKLKIRSQSKRLDGVLPWTANSRCLDANGKMIEEHNIFGNYKSYGLSTSEVLVMDMSCDDPTPDGPSNNTSACDFIFTPQGACQECGMEPVKEPATSGKEVLEWVCTEGCKTENCMCMPPLIYDGNGRCKPNNPEEFAVDRLLDGIQYADIRPLDLEGNEMNERSPEGFNIFVVPEGF